MSRSPQNLAPVQTHPSFWTRVIALFARLWRIIWWVWGTVIVGGFLIGVVFVSLVTKGTSGLTDPRTWVVIQPLLAHPLLTIIALIIAGILTLSAFLAHRHQKGITQQQEQAHEKSLVVVAEGVLKLLEDQTSRPVASPPPPSNSVPPLQEIPPTTTWNIPFRRNPLFTGREQILKRLHDQLPTGKAAALTQPQAISGLGGIGKTQTAVEYAYRYRDDYQYIFWVRADKREELVTDFATIASLLNLPEKNAQDQTVIVEAVKHWLETHSGWLLILDNADDLEMASKFIPPGGKGHLLLTTRAHAMGHLAQSVEIEKMEPDEGAIFLLRRARIIAQEAPLDTASTTDQAKAREIVQAMDGLPLALDQAGAYIEETRCTLASYLDIYEKQKQRTELLRRRGGVDPDHPLPVASTWSLSFQKVEQANPAAADLLRLCAFLSPDAIPEEIFTQGAPDLGQSLEPVATDQMKLDLAIGELLKYSLLHRNPDTKTLTIHRLVQAVLRDEMNEKMQRQWAERAVRAVNRVFPEVEYETWPRCKRYISHAQVCALLIDQWGLEFPEAARLLNEAGWYLKERGQYTEAEPFSQRALAIRERILGPEHNVVANSRANLGLLYVTQGKYAEAELLYQRALAIVEKALGREHPDVATYLENYAVLLRKTRREDEAEKLKARAREIRAKHERENPVKRG
jgi:tetratricopeptide (TPR) repeat protein